MNESKSILAKLLAKENITVRYGNYHTASFDVNNRTLCLPMWKYENKGLLDMLVGHEVGATFDKIDEMYATMLLAQSLTLNEDMQSSTWKNPKKNVAVNAMPVTTEGECREFITSVQVDKVLTQMRGTACLVNNEWELKEIY